MYQKLPKAKARQRILSGNVPAHVNIMPNNVTTSLSLILLRQAEEILRKKMLDADKLKLLKVCVSRIVNLLNPGQVVFYREIIPTLFMKTL